MNPKLLKYITYLGAGVVKDQLPNIAHGLFVQLLSKATLNEAIDWVNQNKNLWQQIKPEYRTEITTLAPKLGNLDWLTSEWLIESLKSDRPELASLFLGWQKARNWLNRQIADLKIQGGADGT